MNISGGLQNSHNISDGPKRKIRIRYIDYYKIIAKNWSSEVARIKSKILIHTETYVMALHTFAYYALIYLIIE